MIKVPTPANQARLTVFPLRIQILKAQTSRTTDWLSIWPPRLSAVAPTLLLGRRYRHSAFSKGRCRALPGRPAWKRQVVSPAERPPSCARLPGCNRGRSMLFCYLCVLLFGLLQLTVTPAQASRGTTGLLGPDRPHLLVSQLALALPCLGCTCLSLTGSMPVVISAPLTRLALQKQYRGPGTRCVAR